MSHATISPADLAKLIKQASLSLSSDEKSKINAQLDEALNSVKVLQELDTAKVLASTSASGLTNVFRDDIVESSFPQELALQNASNSYNGYFVVSAIFDSQDN